MLSPDRVLLDRTLVVPATADSLDAVHGMLDSFWQRAETALPQPPDAGWRMRFAIAIAEIAANIIRHAYPAGVGPGLMRLRLRAYEDRVEARFTDRGTEYVATARQEGPLPENVADLPESGYGMQLAHQVVDEIGYHRTPTGSNRWRLVKHL
jgi:serine/threonine-protein kinase RsbW